VIIQERILKFVVRCNWLLLMVATAISLMFFSPDVGTGVLAGGVIVTINFHLLAKTLKKALTPPHVASIAGVIAKYYLRFLLTGIIISILIIMDLVNPYGLIAGLSIVVASMMLATMNEVRQLLFKEAG
jgi:hypothetical protein